MSAFACVCIDCQDPDFNEVCSARTPPAQHRHHSCAAKCPASTPRARLCLLLVCMSWSRQAPTQNDCKCPPFAVAAAFQHKQLRGLSNLLARCSSTPPAPRCLQSFQATSILQQQEQEQVVLSTRGLFGAGTQHWCHTEEKQCRFSFFKTRLPTKTKSILNERTSKRAQTKHNKDQRLAKWSTTRSTNKQQHRNQWKWTERRPSNNFGGMNR